MVEPNITFTASASKISGVSGYDVVTVTFYTDVAYKSFECRATKEGASYGPGVGTLIAAFSSTPAQISRTFEIYDEYLTSGDGNYRISLYAETNMGNILVPLGSTMLMTRDGKIFIYNEGG